jgi:hypothetical protein
VGNLKCIKAANFNRGLIFLNSAATSYSLRFQSVFLSATVHLNAYFKTQNVRTAKLHKAYSFPEVNRQTEDTKKKAELLYNGMNCEDCSLLGCSTV